MLDVEWRPRAHLDRESIAVYIGIECGNPQTALLVIQDIDSAIERIREFPEIGRIFRDDVLEHREYRMVKADKYMIYYRLIEEKIVIYRILHQRRDIDTFTLIDTD